MGPPVCGDGDRGGSGGGGGDDDRDVSPPRDGRAAGRPACVDVPAFPLQTLLRRRPEWTGLPVVVVDRDEPQGRVLWANEDARRERVLPGHRYAAALALATGLRADVVPEDEIRRAVDETAARLRRFTPSVEPSRDEPGVFRVDAGGLAHLHPDLRVWAEAVRADLADAGLAASVVVGATEFGAYAVARALAARLLTDGGGAEPVGAQPPRASPRVLVLDAAAEARALRRVPLDRLLCDSAGRPRPAASRAGATGPRPLTRPPGRRAPSASGGLGPEAHELLAKLGVRTVADLVALPAEGLRERFGDEVHRLHRLASGEARDPLRPEPAPDPVRAGVLLEHPETDGARLLFVLKRLLDPLLLRTAERQEAVAGLEIFLRLDDGGARTESLRPAAPTLDAVQILDLVRLRIESAPPGADAPGVTEVVLTAETIPASREQLALFAEKPRRDLAAADRALARIRAEFGEDAVVRAQLREGHLPEASFTWEHLERAQLPRVRAPVAVTAAGTAATPASSAAAAAPSAAASRSAASPPGVLVRRLLARPLPLPPRPRHEPDGWMLHGFEHGSVVRIEGPFVVSGGWWAGEEVRREYHFAETAKGRVFWIFHDVRRRRWFLHGEVS